MRIFTDKEIARWLEEFFFVRKKKNTIRKSPVWKVLKEELSKSNNWRNAPRGKPGGKYANDLERRQSYEKKAQEKRKGIDSAT